MASKRRVRRRACEGKVRHPDEERAVAHCERLERQSSVAYHAYHCRLCGCWHVGRMRTWSAAQAKGRRPLAELLGREWRAESGMS